MPRSCSYAWHDTPSCGGKRGPQVGRFTQSQDDGDGSVMASRGYNRSASNRPCSRSRSPRRSSGTTFILCVVFLRVALFDFVYFIVSVGGRASQVTLEVPSLCSSRTDRSNDPSARKVTQRDQACARSTGHGASSPPRTPASVSQRPSARALAKGTPRLRWYACFRRQPAHDYPARPSLRRVPR